jgi:hypothetical protein
MSMRVLYGKKDDSEDENQIKIRLVFPESIKKDMIKVLQDKEMHGFVFSNKDETTEVTIRIDDEDYKNM